MEQRLKDMDLKKYQTTSLPGMDHNKLWKILKEMGMPDHLTCLLRNLYTGQEATVRKLDMEQCTGSKLGKKYVKAIYCHPAYLIYMHHVKCQAG